MNVEKLGLNALFQPALNGNVEPGNLIVVLHGRGDSVQGFEWLQSELGIADLGFLLLNAPDSYYTGFSWYELPPNQLPGIARSSKLLGGVFLELFAQGYLPEQCFLFGFSQGSLMTLEFGSRFKKILAGYIGISGYCYDPEKLLQEAGESIKSGRWLVTHGTQDDVLPVGRTRDQMNFLKNSGFQMDYREFQKSHTIDPQKELPLIRDWILERMRK